jgi:hypothetical protein
MLALITLYILGPPVKRPAADLDSEDAVALRRENEAPAVLDRGHLGERKTSRIAPRLRRDDALD